MQQISDSITASAQQRKGHSQAERFGVPHFLSTPYSRAKGIQPQFPHGIVSSVSFVSTTNTARSLAGFVSLALALTPWRGARQLGEALSGTPRPLLPVHRCKSQRPLGNIANSASLHHGKSSIRGGQGTSVAQIIQERRETVSYPAAR